MTRLNRLIKITTNVPYIEIDMDETRKVINEYLEEAKLRFDQDKENIMTENENRKEVLANDNDIKRQVPGILLDHTGIEKPQELRNEELFHRAIAR